MATKAIRWMVAAALLAAAGVGGCSADNGGTEASEQESGRLHLELVTRAGQTYRLRFALFEITNASGAVVATLDSEVDPDAVSLTADLPQGTYSVRLLDGWTLEQIAGDGSASPSNAALVSPNPRSVQIRHEVTTEVVFTFATEAGTVTLGVGAVSIGIDTTPTGALTSCDLLTQAGCAPGQSCLLANEAGDTFCAQPGSLAVGSSCSAEQCVAGAQCLRVGGDATAPGVCTRFCDPSSNACGCQALSVPGVGVCQTGGGGGGGTAFEGSFLTFQAPDAATCEAWNTFRGQVSTGIFSRVTMSGSLDSAVQQCNDPAAATAICNSLAAGSPTSIACDGHTWNIGDCSGVELAVDDAICFCTNPGHSVRPCIGNENWGGVGTDTCFAPSQTMRVSCE